MNEQFNIKVNTELKQQFKDIAKKGNKKQVNLINEILTDYFKTRQLNEDFLTFPNTFYFNVNELLINKTIQATPEPPQTNMFKYFSCSRMPINCDSWSIKNNSYCFKDNLNHHKGIIFNIFEINNYILPCYIYFNYLNNELTIKLYNLKEFKLINAPNKTSLLNEYPKFKRNINDILNKVDFTIEKLDPIIKKIDPITLPERTDKFNYIDNHLLYNYSFFKPFFIDKILNNAIDELKTNGKENIIISEREFNINDLENLFNNKFYNDPYANSEKLIREFSFVHYCKDII